MTEIYCLLNNLYEVHSKYASHGIETNLVGLFTYMTHSLGFSANEIEIALLDILDKNNDSAHFGYNKTFIYSFTRAKKYGSVA